MLYRAIQPSTQPYRSVCFNTNSTENLPPTMDAEFTLDRISPHQQSDWTESQHTFAASFMAMQQVIAASQIALQDKMEKFLEFLEQQSKNTFTQLSPPHKRHSTTDAMYSQAATYRYFLTAHCTPTQAGDHWHHHISRTQQCWPIFTNVRNMDPPHNSHQNLKI